MPKLGVDWLDATYAAAERWVDVALRRDGSLFTPGRAIWSKTNLDDLHRRFVEKPDFGEGSFGDKFEEQLDGSPDDTLQLAAEVFYIHHLPASNERGANKRGNIGRVLGRMTVPVAIPPELDKALDQGIGSGGSSFFIRRPAQVSYVITFVRHWKELPEEIRAGALADPWRFKEVASEVPPAEGATFASESVLYLVHPDTFERFFSRGHKYKVVDRFQRFVQPGTNDIDRKIFDIRQAMTPRFGQDFDFYWATAVHVMWSTPKDPWERFLHWARMFRESPTFDASERDYKLTIAERLKVARDAVLAEADWFPQLKRAFGYPNNLTPFQMHTRFLAWCEANESDARDALLALWGPDASGPGDWRERLSSFLARVPREAAAGPGMRVTLASFLLMAIDAIRYPVYRPTPFERAYALTGFNGGPATDEPEIYARALQFLDAVLEKAVAKGIALRDPLDAQSVVWSVTKTEPADSWWPEEQRAFLEYRGGTVDHPDDEVDPPEPELHEPATRRISEDAELIGPTPAEARAARIEALAEELLVDLADLHEIVEILESKRQVILYGPPGTGKTYLARLLARALAGDDQRVRLVQFHPSYAYEDFVEGYRPRLVDGMATFALNDGPLKRIAAAADAKREEQFVLIIDELNRGNVAKVLGELYFLLEYRDEVVSLQYSDRPFKLPANLRLIGTMNTADRSIALLDSALRRRFGFVPFFPDRPPMHGLLRKWLHKNRPGMTWVADVVDLANTRLIDRNTAIGPSYFLRPNLDETRIGRIWRHEIEPYLEDLFFDEPERVREFDLGRLRAEAAGAQAPYVDLGEEEDGADEAGSARGVPSDP